MRHRWSPELQVTGHYLTQLYKNGFSPWGWLGACPVGLCSVHPCRSWKTFWTWCWATCRELAPDGLQRPFQPGILWWISVLNQQRAQIYVSLPIFPPCLSWRTHCQAQGELTQEALLLLAKCAQAESAEELLAHVSGCSLDSLAHWSVLFWLGRYTLARPARRISLICKTNKRNCQT